MPARGEEWAARLEAAAQKLLSAARGWDPVLCYVRPTREAWSLMEILAHTGELLPYWTAQIEQIQHTPGAPFGRTHEDPERIAFVAAHARDRVDDALGRIDGESRGAAALLRSLDAPVWDLSGQHPRRSSMSVEQVVDLFLCSHLEEHLAQALETARAVGKAWGDSPE